MQARAVSLKGFMMTYLQNIFINHETPYNSRVLAIGSC